MKLLPTKTNFIDVGYVYFGAAGYAYMQPPIPAWVLLATGAFAWAIAAIMDFVEFRREQQNVDRTDASPSGTSA